MYPVSEMFQVAIDDNAREYYWSGIITSKFGKPYPFHSNDIVQGTGYIQQANSGDLELGIGSVYAAECGVSLYVKPPNFIPPLHQATIEFFFHLKVATGQYETIPMGQFDISEVNRRQRVVEIKGFDAMIRFDKRMTIKDTFGEPFDLLHTICEKCQVPFGMTKEEVERLPNGKRLLSLYAENDVETYRDYLHYLTQCLAGFATINRQGKLVIKHNGTQSVARLDSSKRFDTSVSDYRTHYTGVSSTNLKTKFSEYYSIEKDVGSTLNLGINPLMQLGLKEQRRIMCEAILSVVSQYEFVPIDTTIIGNPAYEVGDAFEFHFENKWYHSLMTEVYYPIHGRMRIRCVGKNPLYSSAKSKHDKNIIGLLSQIEAEKIMVYSFYNASEYPLSVARIPIIDIDFASVRETDAQFHATILLNAEESFIPGTHIQLTYSIDGIEETKHVPMMTLQPGANVLTVYYPLSGLIENRVYRFKVVAELNKTSSVNIPADGIVASISGQGLAAEKGWDGRIELSDTFIRKRKKGEYLLSIRDQVMIDAVEKEETTASETFERMNTFNNNNLRG
ncbi:hypothetical protein I4Q36_05155 [Tuanshanicoccus lijuaniae]|uniref:hypothetical protein n=1 Tax=Aerococcaceae bacterium zg-1292 TaxID=2774330 RepID=UPI0019360862|nr:hypothetical protein [Aerococcaceae bacterium zg-1292]QQA38060.1 hypothetical protein I4Q36_05155 [Aerococcaceae bacterium zg-1292]